MQQIIVDFGVVDLFGAQVPLRIYGYGLMLVLGFLSSIWLARWRARRGGANPDVISTCGVLALVGGVAGARLAYVIENGRKFFSDPNPLGAILNVTSGGLIYYGGVAGAMIAILAYLHVKRLPLRRYLDVMAASFMLGLAFGRAGCLLNGCCYGGACSADWPLATRFPMFSRPLLKLDGSPGPFSAGTDSPTPVFSHQWDPNRVPPGLDQRLVVHLKARDGSDKFYVRTPRALHGTLDQPQLAVTLGPKEEARAKFGRLTGGGEWVTADLWAKGLAQKDGFLRGSESWEEAAAFARVPGRLDFAEAWAYLQDRKAALLTRFDADGDGQLARSEREAAEEYLKADLFALAAAEKSGPVRPAQLLSMVNALVLCGVLTAFYRLRRREGEVILLLLALYPLTRIVEESIRDDNPHDLSKFVFTHNQVVSMLIMLVATVLWMWLRRLPAQAGRAAAQPPPHA